LLDAWLRRLRFSPAEARLAMEIVYGVVRRQATLEALIGPHVKRPRQQVEQGLWTLMQIGAYQLTFLASVPPHAALDETVETAKRMGTPRWAGFLNGVLRSVAGSLTEEYVDRPAADAVPLTLNRQGAGQEQGGPSPLPLSKGERGDVFRTYRRSRRAVFADPKREPVEYVARAFSFPRWLVERWRQRFGVESVFQLGFWFNTPARICLRVNRLKASHEAFVAALAEAGIESHEGAHPAAVWLDQPARIAELPGYAAGWFAVQDETAMHAADLLAPRPGERVLDLCAAPGTKTAQLCERMENRGTILATDVDAGRLVQVEENARRLGCGIIETRLIARDGGDIPAGPFDAILIDAPCSNTGVLGKRPEARWRLRPEDIAELATLQARLLRQARKRLAPGGRIVYSTCSIEPEENTNVVRTAFGADRSLRLIEEREFIPGKPTDGGYAALLKSTVPEA
jgi:16S rRNA (cytosine967-C5)-methyltransferase